MAHIKKILVPVDDSACSLAALTHAAALADDLDASIDVLFVPTESEPVLSGAIAAAVGSLQTRLGERLARREQSGDPLRTIIETAREGGFDLIVMGTHGRVGRLRSLIGSVAEAVVRNAPCPVFTVREPGGEAEGFGERVHGRPSIAEQSR